MTDRRAQDAEGLVGSPLRAHASAAIERSLPSFPRRHRPGPQRLTRGDSKAPRSAGGSEAARRLTARDRQSLGTGRCSGSPVGEGSGSAGWLRPCSWPAARRCPPGTTGRGLGVRTKAQPPPTSQQGRCVAEGGAPGEGGRASRCSATRRMSPGGRRVTGGEPTAPGHRRHDGGTREVASRGPPGAGSLASRARRPGRRTAWPLGRGVFPQASLGARHRARRSAERVSEAHALQRTPGSGRARCAITASAPHPLMTAPRPQQSISSVPHFPSKSPETKSPQDTAFI